MMDIANESGRYAIRITDPDKPEVVLGYALVSEDSFVAASGDDAVAEDAIAGLAKLFAAGPLFQAVRLPSYEQEEGYMKAMAKPGSAHD